MNPALGPFAIAAILLVVGGVLKALRPDETARAVRGVGVPAGESAVRVLGASEAALGVVALVAVDTTIASLVAASYVVFVAFVLTALVRHLPIASCGCFGKTDAPPSWLHVGVNGGAIAAACALAIDPATSPLEVVTEHFPESVAFVALVVVGVLAAFVTLTLLPRALALIPEGNDR